VRLGHNGLFLHEFAEGRGRLILKPAVQTAKHAKYAKKELSKEKFSPPSWSNSWALIGSGFAWFA